MEFHPVVFRPTTGDQRLAALVGYMVGDGAIALRSQKYKKKNGTTSVYKSTMTGAFYSNEKEDLIEIRDSLANLGLSENTTVTRKKTPDHLADGWQIQLSKTDCETMAEAGVPVGKKTTLTFEVPEWIKTSDLQVKRAFVAALFGAEGSTPTVTKGGVRTMRPIVMSMFKVDPTQSGNFFEDVRGLLLELGVRSTLTLIKTRRFEKDYVGYCIRISGSENIISYLSEVGYVFCEKKAVLAWKWLQYLRAYRKKAQDRRETVLRMKSEKADYATIGRAVGLTRGAAWRLIADIESGKGNTAGHAFPEFPQWIAERWNEDRGLLRLSVISCVSRPAPEEVWNLLVSSHDHSYLLANGANNFNSFETMSGRVYYTFDRKIHLKPLAFNPALPLWIGQDFNIDPMSSVVFQPQKDGELWAIDEIYLPNSNTEELCDELERRYWRYLDQIVIYPDPAGAYGSTKGRGESDLDIFRKRGFIKQKYRRKHPAVTDRVNAVNRMLKAADGSVRMYVDPRCKKFVEGLEQTLYVPGSREVDKRQGVEHPVDAAGYCIEFEYPVRKIEILGVSI